MDVKSNRSLRRQLSGISLLSKKFQMNPRLTWSRIYKLQQLVITGVFDVWKYRHFYLRDFHLIPHRRHKLFEAFFCVFSRSYLLYIYLQTSLS